MNQSAAPFSLRDIFHAAILLVLVPVVFYGGYQLVSSSADTEQGEPIDIVNEGVEKAKNMTASLLNRSGPSPGIAWVDEVSRLEEKLLSTEPVDRITSERLDVLENQLSRIRQHCESHMDNVPDSIRTDSLLGQALVAIEEELGLLRRPGLQPAPTLSWEAAYNNSEEKRLAQQAVAVRDMFQQQVAPMRRAHAMRFAALSRQNRELADELQRTLDSIEKIKHDSREQLAKRQRLQAYAKDKHEIERLLKPFITPGYEQIREHWNDWKKTADKKPLSYRDLERVGALATDIKGIRTFARIGGMRIHMNPNSARPLGSFPAYYDNTLSKPAQLETIKRAQQLIKQHSVYLIEAGLLQP